MREDYGLRHCSDMGGWVNVKSRLGNPLTRCNQLGTRCATRCKNCGRLDWSPNGGNAGLPDFGIYGDKRQSEVSGSGGNHAVGHVRHNLT
jgi:hypothetical protein